VWRREMKPSKGYQATVNGSPKDESDTKVKETLKV